MRLIIAFSVAILVPAGFVASWYAFVQFAAFPLDDPYIWIRIRSFLLLCIAITAIHVIVLGVPGYIILRWRNALRWWSILLSGFIMGAIPEAVLTWPLRYSELQLSAVMDGVQTMINGVPTMAGWLQFLVGVAYLGTCGVAGAAGFWFVWRKKANTLFNPDAQSRTG
jgi:hypothetical protein